MKLSIPSILAVVLISSNRVVNGFQPSKTKVTRCTELHGFFDFNPVHGGGSGGNKQAIDEQWEAQQAILRARQGHTTKNVLKQKYKDPSKVDVSSAFVGKDFAPKKAPSAPAKQGGFKMPWDK